MAQPVNMTALFRDIFENPTLGRMLSELDPYQFEDFVGYVFERAGFTVEDTATQYGPGLDLKLYTFPTPVKRVHAGVSVKKYTPPDQKVNAREINNLRGGLATIGGVPGYVVTTSTLNEPAITQALKTPRMWWLDGEHLLRYITYTYGTRSEPNNATGQQGQSDPPLAPILPESFEIADSITRRPSSTTKVLAVANH
jgi:restriction endonuclease